MPNPYALPWISSTHLPLLHIFSWNCHYVSSPTNLFLCMIIISLKKKDQVISPKKKRKLFFFFFFFITVVFWYLLKWLIKNPYNIFLGTVFFIISDHINPLSQILNGTPGFLFSSYSSHPTDLCQSDHLSDLEDGDKYPPEVQTNLIYTEIPNLRLYIS